VPVAPPPADSESIAKARETLRQKMKELDAQPPASTNAPASAAAKPAPTKPMPTATKPEAKPAMEKAPKKPVTVKNAPVFPAIQGPASPVSGDKQQRLAELLRKYKADEFTPEEYHLQRAKIMSEP
jgi:hypothetical protein